MARERPERAERAGVGDVDRERGAIEGPGGVGNRDGPRKNQKENGAHDQGTILREQRGQGRPVESMKIDPDVMTVSLAVARGLVSRDDAREAVRTRGAGGSASSRLKVPLEIETRSE